MFRIYRRPVARLILAGGLALATLAGCVACTADTPQPQAQDISDADVPAFSGPNAAEFESAWLATDSEFVRGILEDEQISEQEWAEVSKRLQSCIEDQGMQFTGFDPDGAYNVEIGGVDSEKVDALLSECEKDSGEHWAGYLRWVAAENPEGKPIETLITECMVQTGVVGADYTPEKYLRDAPTLDFPYLDPVTGPDGFWACNSNPSTVP